VIVLAPIPPVLPGGGVRLAVRFGIFPPSPATACCHDPDYPLSYRDAGVDIDAGDAPVDRIKRLARKTMHEGVLGGIARTSMDA